MTPERQSPARSAKASALLLAVLAAAAFAAQAAGPAAILVTQTSPFAVLTLRARDVGILDELSVARGQDVQAGQTVARLDDYRQIHNCETTKRRMNSKAALEIASADLREKSEALEEAVTKHKRRQISDTDLTRAMVSKEKASAALDLVLESAEQAKQENALANRALQDRWVQCPIPGRVLDIMKTPGERVQAGETVMTIGDFSKLKADVPLSKEAAAKLVPGGVLPVKLSPNGPEIKAVIESISGAPNAQKGEKIIKVVFENPEAVDSLLSPDTEFSPPASPSPAPAAGAAPSGSPPPAKR